MKNPLKHVSQEDLKRAEQARASSGSAKLFLLLKEGNTQYEFTEGTHNLRLVPQPADAKDTWTGLIQYCYLSKQVTPSFYGYFAFTEEQAKLNREIQNYLYNSKWEPRMKRAQKNPTGIDFGIKYRAIFYGFNYSDPDPKMSPILLPANAPRAGTTRLQVGTRIKQFMYEKDIHGNYKHGDLVNLDSGRIIQITVTGSKDRTEYIPSVDAVAPLVDDSGNVLARYESLIKQVRPFEDIIAYHDNEVFEQIIMAKLHEDMRDDIRARFFKGSTVTISAPNPTSPVQNVEEIPPTSETPVRAEVKEPTQDPVQPSAEEIVSSTEEELDLSKIDWSKVTPEQMQSPAFKKALEKASRK